MVRTCQAGAFVGMLTVEGRTSAVFEVEQDRRRENNPGSSLVAYGLPVPVEGSFGPFHRKRKTVVWGLQTRPLRACGSDHWG